MTEQTIEQEIQDKGKTAPRITPDHIESVIVAEHYFTAEEGAKMNLIQVNFDDDFVLPPSLRFLTFCVLTLQNGFTVTGESACASPENFDEEIGKKIARENAREKIWLLEGYLLKQKLFDRERGYSIGLPHEGSPLTSGSVGGDELDAGLASSNIKRDNSLLFAEKFLEFNENIVVHDEEVNTLQIELEQMAQEIIAINRSTDTLQA